MIVPYYKWSKTVREQWGHKCAYCGRSEDEWYLQAHHIKPRSLYPELELETDNGIALCKRCHGIVHCSNALGTWDFIELEVDPDNRIRIEAAAAAEGKTVCRFVTEGLLAAHPELELTCFLPAEYIDKE